MSPSNVQISGLENSSELEGGTDIGLNRKSPHRLLGLLLRKDLPGFDSVQKITGQCSFKTSPAKVGDNKRFRGGQPPRLLLGASTDCPFSAPLQVSCPPAAGRNQAGCTFRDDKSVDSWLPSGGRQHRF